MKISLEEVKRKAHEELYEKSFREAVEKEKEKMRQKKSIMAKLFPWKIIVIRRG